MNHPALLILVAFMLDLLVGDPAYPLHPVRLFGRLIRKLEIQLRKRCSNLVFASVLLPLLSLAIAGLTYLIVHRMLGPMDWIWDLYLCYSLLALGDLLKHANDVVFALNNHSLEKARSKVQWMVGRDTAQLDTHAIARATIESVAENFVDGFLSPLFWFGVGTWLTQSASGGVLFLLSFKVISTLDSMVGYKNEAYVVLGRISAKLDDCLNFMPARLSIPFIAIAAKLTSNKAKDAWRIGLRDRLKHASPNSAHAEAAIAGALGLRLGGPAIYSNITRNHPWLGDGSANAVPNDIIRAIKMVRTCGYTVMVILTSIMILKM